MKNSASNPSVLLKSERIRIRKLYESTTAANSGSYSQPMAWSEEIPSPCADETYGDNNIVDGSEELTLDVDQLMDMLNLSEKEDKERMRKLHKENSIIKEDKEDMIQGISISDLHPYVYESLKNKKKLTAAQMLKMMAGCYEDDEEMQTLLGGASNYTSTASGGQKINAGRNRKKGTLHLSYRNGHGSEVWENLCDFPDQIYGEWTSLPGFEWDQELLKSISDYWEAAGGLKNLSDGDEEGVWDDEANDYDRSGELSVEQKQQRYETGKKLMWKFDDQNSWYLAVR